MPLDAAWQEFPCPLDTTQHYDVRLFNQRVIRRCEYNDANTFTINGQYISAKLVIAVRPYQPTDS